MRRLVVVSLVGLLAYALPTPAAAAAPSYVSSEPEDGEELHQAPDRVSITFSEPLDPSSTITVEDACGRAVDDGNVQIDVNEMRVGIAKKPSGHYEVSYAAVGVGGITGTENGRFHFMVHAGSPCRGGNDIDHDGHNDDKHNGHDDHNGRHEDHDGRHDGGTHEAGHAGSGGHGSSDHAEHDPAGGEHEERHRAHAAEQFEEQRDAQRTQALRAGATPFPGGVPDAEAVLAALFLCALLGVVGGWVLRVSPLS